MKFSLTTQQLYRFQKGELYRLLDQAYHDLINARPSSPDYYAALSSYENISNLINFKLSDQWNQKANPTTFR